MKNHLIVLITGILISASVRSAGINIAREGTDKAYFTYNDQRLLAYGGMADFLFWADSSHFDYKKWTGELLKTGLTNLIISIPTNWKSVENFYLSHGGTKAQCEFPFAETSPSSRQFDLTRFNEHWWYRFRQQCRYLQSKGIFLHLIMWNNRQMQPSENIETGWSGNFFNSDNNVNECTDTLSAGNFVFYHSVADHDSALLNIQKRFFQKILGETSDIDNIYYDLTYRLADNQGEWGKTQLWINQILDHLQNVWNKLQPQRKFIVGLDVGGLSEYQQHWVFSNTKLPVMINSTTVLPEEALYYKTQYTKPYIAIENSYFATGNDRIGIRKHLWQYNLNDCQFINALPNSNLPENWETLSNKKELTSDIASLLKFCKSADNINTITNEGKISGGRLYKTRIIVSSPHEIMVYLSSANGIHDKMHKAETITIEKTNLEEDGIYSVTFWDPSAGKIASEITDVIFSKGKTMLEVPDFIDDIAILISKKNY
jgi:hypothetical protein